MIVDDDIEADLRRMIAEGFVRHANVLLRNGCALITFSDNDM